MDLAYNLGSPSHRTSDKVFHLSEPQFPLFSIKWDKRAEVFVRFTKNVLLVNVEKKNI